MAPLGTMTQKDLGLGVAAAISLGFGLVVLGILIGGKNFPIEVCFLILGDLDSHIVLGVLGIVLVRKG